MTTNSPDKSNQSSPKMFMAMELSATKWKLAFAVGLAMKPRIRTIDAGDLPALTKEIDAAKKAFDLPPETTVVSGYEAGRDGFWLHRCLLAMKIENWIIEPASIEVNRRKRRAKTDRLDVERIVRTLMRYVAGDRAACRMVQAPDAEDEDIRHLHREMHTIKSEKTRHVNRIKGLLATQGIRNAVIGPRFKSNLPMLRTPDNRPLLEGMQQRLGREFDRLKLAVEQLRELQRQQAEIFRRAAKQIVTGEKAQARKELAAHIACRLAQLNGIGPVSSWMLATEVFSWRNIQNRRQLAALAGLTPTPHASGSEEKEQGISKSGRAELRSMMIEIAWGWLLFQPDSSLSKWYQRRFNDGTKRNKKRGIVALARKLLVALSKYIRFGEIPEGATIGKSLKFHYEPSLELKKQVAA